MPAISTFANLFSLGTLVVAAWVAFHMATKPSNSNLNGKLELYRSRHCGFIRRASITEPMFSAAIAVFSRSLEGSKHSLKF